MAPQEQLHHPTAPVLVLDWGGVLTTPVQAAFDSWLAAAQIDPDAFMHVMREFHDTPDSPCTAGNVARSPSTNWSRRLLPA